MKQKSYLISIFIIVSFHVFGQQDITDSVNDFNNDGIPDTLRSYYEGGSGFGGRHIEVINGKTNEFFELNSEGWFCEIRRVVLIPPELSVSENKSFLEVIEKQLLSEKRREPEGSLDWIIRGAFSNVEPDSNLFFDLIIDPQTDWADHFELPQNYYLEIEGDTLKKLYCTSYETTEWYNEKDTKGLLIYFAHNHYRSSTGDSLVLSDSNAIYKVFHTSHGVMIKKGDLYKWVFISDIGLTGAPEKLRWESIAKINLIDNYVILQHNMPPNDQYNIFVINVETGICGKLKFELSNSGSNDVDGSTTFFIKGNDITVIDGGEPRKVSLNDIFMELEKQYLSGTK